MIFGFPFITFIYTGGFLFSKHEAAFKYVFLFLSLVTALENLLGIWIPFMLVFARWTNPLVTVVYAMFDIILSTSDF